MQFFAMPVMGALSDRFGRRPVILLSNLGLGFDYLLMALAPNLWWLFVGRLISGVTAASISTAMAYVADVTPPERRAQSFGLVGVAFGVGFVLGPAVGGLLGSVDPRLPFWARGHVQPCKRGIRLLRAAGIACRPSAGDRSSGAARIRWDRFDSCARIARCSGSRAPLS